MIKNLFFSSQQLTQWFFSIHLTGLQDKSLRLYYAMDMSVVREITVVGKSQPQPINYELNGNFFTLNKLRRCFPDANGLTYQRDGKTFCIVPDDDDGKLKLPSSTAKYNVLPKSDAGKKTSISYCYNQLSLWWKITSWDLTLLNFFIWKYFKIIR